MTFPPRRHTIGFAVALVALQAVVFRPVTGFEFVRWDDDINITRNPLMTEPWSWNLVQQMFSGDQAMRFKPLHWLVTRGLREVAGFDPAAWHGFSLGLHLIAAVLFFGVLRQIFVLRAMPDGKAGFAAFFGAALWSVHPLRAEAVGWATASPYLCVAVLLLGSFACYLKAHAKAPRPERWLFGCWLLAVLSYGFYPIGITYGLWLMAVDRWLLGIARPRELRWWLKHGAFLLPAAVAVGFTLWVRLTAPGIFGAAPDLDAVGWPLRAGFALASLAALAWRLVWPIGLTPNLAPLVLNNAALLYIAAAAVAAGGVLFFAWRRRGAAPLFALVVFGFAALSLPCLGLTERPTWPVDRYSYLAHLILIGGVAGATAVFSGRRLLAARGVMIGLVLTAAIATGKQLPIWRTSDTLFTHMERQPDFAASARQQGHIYILWAMHAGETNRPERAAELSNRAYEIYLAAIKRALAADDHREALKLLTHVERYFSLTPVLRREKAAWLLRSARPDEALRELALAAPELSGDERLRTLRAEAESAVHRHTAP